MNDNQLSLRLQVIQEQIRQACRTAGRLPEEVLLVAVSKRQPDKLLREAWEAGQVDFGENYVQELLRKTELLPEARFHLIGHLQTNKAKKAGCAAWVHTVDSLKLARALAKGMEGDRPPLSVLIEVNIAAEAQKAGVSPPAVERLILEMNDVPKLAIQGLMCIPPRGQGRRWFAALRNLAEELRVSTGYALPTLSMGMSEDFVDAILEGSTMVRVGTAIFGPRDS
ncbi:MAG: YggS family pyridoxal phosphate-dependent enzyme [Myxococcales bacterium]|nr:YggS family pyridoxal phosphate-dependent enzyme [Myxococcales bacterium]